MTSAMPKKVCTLLFVIILGISVLLTGCSAKNAHDENPSIQVSESGVTSLNDCNLLEINPLPANVFNLPVGSFVEVDSENIAAVRSLTGLAHPLQEVGLVTLSSGSYTKVLEKAVGNDEGYEICDVRASDEAMVWVESKDLSSKWRVYRASLSGTTLGEPKLLASGGQKDLLPPIAIWKNTAIWVKALNEDVRETGDVSFVYGSTDGAEQKTTIYETNKPISVAPQVAGDTLTVAIKSRVSSSIRTEIYALDLTSKKVVSSLLLPAPISISDAIYLDGNFSFSVPALYDGVGPLGKVGTYIQTGKKTFIRLPKEPMDTPSLSNGKFIAKNGKSTVVLDTAAKSYYMIEAPDSAPDYGEYLGAHGINSNVVLFTQPPGQDGAPATSTAVRIFKP